MDYYLANTVDCTFDEAIERVTRALSAQGFGVLTEIDVQATLKEKLNIDFRRYRILGACNPPFAHKALQTEDRIGLLLPCNVVVQETRDGKVEVSAINPPVAMASVENKALEPVAGEVSAKLKAAIDSI